MISSAAFPNVAFNNPRGSFAHSRGQRLGRAPYPSRQRNNAGGRANEKRRGILRTRPEPQYNRDRHKQKGQVSDGFSFTMNTGCIADAKFGLGTPSAGVRFKVALASSLRFGPFDSAARIQNTDLARTELARLRF